MRLKRRKDTRSWPYEAYEQTIAGCWRWRCSRQGAGYGTLRWGSSVQLAHRVAYTLFVGPIPAGLDLDHLCRNRWCVNPEHLEPVTRRENILRGQGMGARYAARTHCASGHELTGANVYTRPGTRERVCRTCKALSRQRA